MTDKPTTAAILAPLLAYLREGNNQTRINEALAALAQSAAYLVVGTDVPEVPKHFFRSSSMYKLK
jgi:hypothetical protein